jgi:hypothetical protein
VLHSCQPTKWRFLNRFQRLSLPFFSCLSLSLLKLSSKKKKKKKKRCWPRLQRAVGHRRELQRSRPSIVSCSTTGPALQVATLLAIVAAASYNPLSASPQQRATTFYQPRHSIATLCRPCRSVALPGAAVQRRHLPSQQRRLSSARPTSVELSSDFRRTSD